MKPRIATSDDEVRACFAVMTRLRPHVAVEDFLPRVRLQEKEGYRLAYIERDERAVAVAGFRILENLAWGRFLYVDDLVTQDEERSHGHGGVFLDWLIARAKEAGCNELHLDSGVQRHDAHRFYIRRHMQISSHHFSLHLGG